MSGGILSDRAIADAVARKTILIDPFDPAQLNPASYDMTLGDKVLVYADVVSEDPEKTRMGHKIARDGRHIYPRSSGCRSPMELFSEVMSGVLDSKKELPTLSFSIGEGGLILVPGILYLMHTREVIGPCAYVGLCDGKSSLGRLGILVHQTAGFIDCGFLGQITLEVTVVHPVRVYAGMRFAAGALPLSGR